MTLSDLQIDGHDEEYARILEQETLVVEVTELIAELMEQQSVHKAELARLLGKSRAHVTQLLSGERNMTLHTLAEVLHVLGHRASVSATPARTSATSGAGDDGQRVIHMEKWRQTRRDQVWSRCAAGSVADVAAEAGAIYQAL